MGELMHKSVTLAAAFAASILVAPAASAATMFDFTGLSPSSTSLYEDTQDGISLDVTGERRDDGVFIFPCVAFGAANVTTASDGLGVGANSGACAGNVDSAELDGQIDEILQFSFDQDVRLISIGFNAIDDDDPYNIFVDSGSGFTSVATGALDNPYVFSPFLTGNTLRIGATDNASAFRVTNLTIAAVPLPAGGLLLLGALGGLGALRRRKKPS